MGMDLIGAGLSYNWQAWCWLRERLQTWGVDTSELSSRNDGDPISAATCVAIADALQTHLEELSPTEKSLVEPHIDAWRNCHGCSQG